MYSSGNYGKNEWVGSVMQTYLNGTGEYYTRTGTASTYGLKATAKNMISDAKYYLGGAVYNGNLYGYADAIYLWERGNETFSYETYCQYNSSDTKCTTANYCENNPTDEICIATRSTSWVGEVALMYPSDEYLVYANGVDNICYNNPTNCWLSAIPVVGAPTTGWVYNSNNLEDPNNIIYNWFVSPESSNSSYVFLAYSYGDINGYSNARGSYGTRPVLYLSSNVKITDGTGESTNPYKLGL